MLHRRDEALSTGDGLSRRSQSLDTQEATAAKAAKAVKAPSRIVGDTGSSLICRERLRDDFAPIPNDETQDPP